jgi:hypothetical protein
MVRAKHRMVWSAAMLALATGLTSAQAIADPGRGHGGHDGGGDWGWHDRGRHEGWRGGGGGGPLVGLAAGTFIAAVGAVAGVGVVSGAPGYLSPRPSSWRRHRCSWRLHRSTWHRLRSGLARYSPRRRLLRRLLPYHQFRRSRWLQRRLPCLLKSCWSPRRRPRLSWCQSRLC